MTSLLTGHNCNLLFIVGNGYLCKCEGCGAHRSNHQEIFPLLSVAQATWAALLFSFLFLSQQEKLVIPPYKTGPRGLNKEKKDKIIKNLCPLMPSKHQVFWKELPAENNSIDLLKNDDCDYNIDENNDNQ